MPWGAVAGAVIGAVASDRSSKKQAEATTESARVSQEYIEKAAKQAREDLFNMYPQAQAMQQAGYQGALDMFGQYVPEQIGAYQQGNVAAQNALIAGLPQMNNAILGGQIDYSSMQPQQFSYDSSFLNQQLPSQLDFISEQEEATQPNISPFQGLPDWVNQMRQNNPNASIDANGRVIQGSNGGFNFRGFGSTLNPQTMQNIVDYGGTPTYGSGMGGAGQTGSLFSSVFGNTNNRFNTNNSGSMF